MSMATHDSTLTPELHAPVAKTTAYTGDVPLVHCRHYVRNYFDLFLDVLSRIYEAGHVDGPIVVEPGDTVGQALNATEQSVAAALADDESAILALVHTIATDQGASSSQADFLVSYLKAELNYVGRPTFALKAYQFGLTLAGMVLSGSVSQAMATQASSAFRSFGQIVSDMLAFEFPELEDYRIDLTSNPARYLHVTGPYSATLPADFNDLLTCTFGNDITLQINLDSCTLHGSADIEFFKVKNNGSIVEKHEMVTSALGALTLKDVHLALNLTKSLDVTPYTWAPGHTVERAEWTNGYVDVSVESVDLDVSANAATVLLAFYEWHWTVQGLEEEWEELIEDSINDLSDLAGLADIMNGYVRPIAQRFIPVSHVLSSVRYQTPFEADGFTSYQTFAAPSALYETRSVSIRNVQPERPDLLDNAVPGANDPRIDPPPIDPEVGTWTWPSQGSGGGTIPVDISTIEGRSAAVSILASEADLTPRMRALAALRIEGFPVEAIGMLRTAEVDRRRSRVATRPVQAGTMALIQAVIAEGRAQGAGEFVFHYGGFEGQAYLTRAELAVVQRRLAQRVIGPSGIPSAPQNGQVLVPNFDPGVFNINYTDDTPLKTSRGHAGDPGWIGLSTNCYVPSELYRKLRDRGLFEYVGTIVSEETGVVGYEIKGCSRVAADFTGDAPDNAPGVAIAGLTVRLGTNTDAVTSSVVDMRLRLKPVIYGRGCLPDSAVTEVSNALSCVESMTGGEVPLNTRLRQISYRDFVFLSADFTDLERDVQIVNYSHTQGAPPSNVGAVKQQIREAVSQWFQTLPEVPILYNCFRPAGGDSRNFIAQDGWLCIYRRYPFPDLTTLQLG